MPNSIENKAIISIASIYALRMVGLFMLIPLLSVYVQTLKDATPFLIGVALGCYGLTQALLQIPLGACSDRFGRKTVIVIGFIVFAIGSLLAAFSHNIWGIIWGRSLQGAAAIGGATNALLSDLTSAQKRTQAMAVIGITIGCAFTLGITLGPILNAWLSVSKVFEVSFLFAILAIFIVWKIIPTPVKNKEITTEMPLELKKSNLKFWPYHSSILFLHAIFILNFIALPIILQKQLFFPSKNQWMIYLPTIILAFITAIAGIRYAETKNLAAKAFLTAILIIFCAEFLFFFSRHSVFEIALSLYLFFSAFTYLEASIPSALSKLSPENSRGYVLGTNSTCQFLGIFLGGIIGGWLYSHFMIQTLFLFAAGSAIVWALLCKNSFKFCQTR